MKLLCDKAQPSDTKKRSLVPTLSVPHSGSETTYVLNLTLSHVTQHCTCLELDCETNSKSRIGNGSVRIIGGRFNLFFYYRQSILLKMGWSVKKPYLPLFIL